jgi:hypothetical protein
MQVEFEQNPMTLSALRQQVVESLFSGLQDRVTIICFASGRSGSIRSIRLTVFEAFLPGRESFRFSARCYHCGKVTAWRLRLEGMEGKRKWLRT